MHTVWYVGFNVDKKPFTDRCVRQAFNHAVNRDAIVRDILKGTGVPAVGPLPPSSHPPSPVPRLSPQGPPEALPSPILRRLSSTSDSGAAPRSAWLGAAPAGRP